MSVRFGPELQARINAAIDAEPDRSRAFAGVRQTLVLGRITAKQYLAEMGALLDRWEAEDRELAG